jgi:glycosyltransferase involved in cell wall biosynthesis
MTGESAVHPQPAAAPTGLPRVLVLSTWASTFVGGGATLGKLFSRWPAGSVAQIHSDWYEPHSSIAGHLFSVNGPFFNPRAPWCTWHLARLAACSTGRGEHGVFWSRLTPRLKRWIDAFAPEVIYSQPSNPAFLGLTEKIVEYTGLPLVLHAEDDWTTYWPANVLGKQLPLVSSRLSTIVSRRFSRLSARATERLAIGELMARVYEERYGGVWRPFYNAIDPAQWPERSVAAEAAQRSPFRVLYSGSLLGYSGLEGVRDAAEAVARLRSAGVPIELTVATHERDRIHRSELERFDGVHVVGLVPRAQLPERLQSADLLLLPVTFDRRSFHFIHLSIHAKTAEYLASGTPVVVYAPEGSAIVDYATRERWGYAVSSPGPASLAQAFQALMQQPELRRTLGRRGREIALRDFDVNKLLPEFEALMVGASQIGASAGGGVRQRAAAGEKALA